MIEGFKFSGIHITEWSESMPAHAALDDKHIAMPIGAPWTNSEHDKPLVRLAIFTAIE